MRTAFLITSHLRNHEQAHYLQECVHAIKIYHPNDTIIVLHDCTQKHLVPVLEGVHEEDVEEKYQRCGEVNAYVWASKHYEDYDRFVYIHDSAKILQEIPLTLADGMIFRPFWYASKFVDSHTEGYPILHILQTFSLNVHPPWFQIRRGGGNGNVVFGGMGIFTSEFAKKLATETNFLDVANLFNTRDLRCFFERFLWCIVATWQDWSEYRNQALCGCIFNHEASFRNKSMSPHMAHNPYVVKAWSGR